MRAIIGGRAITVSHVDTETTEYGDVQRYRIDMSGSDAVTHLSSLRTSPNVDARFMASVIGTELLLDYEGSTDSGLLRAFDMNADEVRDA